MARTRSFLGIMLSIIGVLSLAACSSKDDNSGSGGSAGAGGSGTGGASGSGNGGSGGSSGSASGGSAGTATGGSGGTGGSPAIVECPTNGPKPIVNKGPGALSADETWTKDNVYMVSGHIGTSSHTLNIEAGTTVCFTPSMDPPEGGNIFVEDGGKLNVNGTADEHVVFTRDVEWTATWDGVHYQTSTGDLGRVEYLDLYFTGSSAGGSLDTPSNKHGSLLDWRNVVFYELQRSGIENLLAGWTPESKITIASYASTVDGDVPAPSYYLNYPVLRMRPESMHTIKPDTFTVAASVPEAVKYVAADHAGGEILDESFTFPKLPSGLTYIIGNAMQFGGDVTAPNTWTIDPGARIAVNGEIKVGSGGTSMTNVHAVGTAAEPIVFTSAAAHITGEAPKPGDWTTMVFHRDNFDPAVTKFEYVHFEYGGGVGISTLYSCDSNAYGGYIGFDMGFGGQFPGFSITNCVFESSSGQAIRSNGNPPNVSTNYTAPATGNQFLGFTNPPAQYIGTCP